MLCDFSTKIDLACFVIGLQMQIKVVWSRWCSVCLSVHASCWQDVDNITLEKKPFIMFSISMMAKTSLCTMVYGEWCMNFLCAFCECQHCAGKMDDSLIVGLFAKTGSSDRCYTRPSSSFELDHGWPLLWCEGRARKT